MKKELLTIEFRYHDKPLSKDFGGHESKTITIGVYDTLDEAIIEGNVWCYTKEAIISNKVYAEYKILL